MAGLLVGTNELGKLYWVEQFLLSFSNVVSHKHGLFGWSPRKRRDPYASSNWQEDDSSRDFAVWVFTNLYSSQWQHLMRLRLQSALARMARASATKEPQRDDRRGRRNCHTERTATDYHSGFGQWLLKRDTP